MLQSSIRTQRWYVYISFFKGYCFKHSSTNKNKKETMECSSVKATGMTPASRAGTASFVLHDRIYYFGKSSIFLCYSTKNKKVIYIHSLNFTLTPPPSLSLSLINNTKVASRVMAGITETCISSTFILLDRQPRFSLSFFCFPLLLRYQKGKGVAFASSSIHTHCTPHTYVSLSLSLSISLASSPPSQSSL